MAGDRAGFRVPVAPGPPAATPAPSRPASAPAAPLVIGAAASRARTTPATRAGAAVPADESRTRPTGLPLGPPARARPPVPLAPPPRPRRPRFVAVREYLAAIGVLQVVCWQIAVVAVLLVVRRPWPVLVAVSVLAALLLAATTVRLGGRWLHQLGVLACGYLTRERRRDLPESGGKTPALLTTLVPGTTVRTTETGHGPVLTVSHPGGLAALLRPSGADTDPAAMLPAPAALLPPVDEQVIGVQVVLHTGVRRDGPPKVWLAVHAARTVDTPRDAELTLVLRNTLRRVRRAAARAGVAVEPVAEEPGFAALAGLAHVTGGRNEIREDWRFWRTGPVCQAAFRLDGTDRLTDAQLRGLVTALFAVTAGVAVTVTLTARTGRPAARVAAVLRFAATTEAAVAAAVNAARSLLARPAPARVHLVRLDGAQSRGVAASLPIGVFPT
jgi:type VII secretion protein EccE